MILVMQEAAQAPENSALTIVATIVRSDKRRFISVPADFHEALDSLKGKRFLVRVSPLA